MSVASDGASSSCWNLEDCTKTRMGGDLQKEKDEAVQHEEVKTSDDTSTVCNEKQH